MAIVQAEEGVKFVTNLVGIKNDSIKVGMPVEVTFDDVTEEFAIPKWKPVPK